MSVIIIGMQILLIPAVVYPRNWCEFTIHLAKPRTTLRHATHPPTIRRRELARPAVSRNSAQLAGYQLSCIALPKLMNKPQSLSHHQPTQHAKPRHAVSSRHLTDQLRGFQSETSPSKSHLFMYLVIQLRSWSFGCSSLHFSFETSF